MLHTYAHTCTCACETGGERLSALGGYHALPSLEEAQKARLLLFFFQGLERLHTGDQRADLPQQYAQKLKRPTFRRRRRGSTREAALGRTDAVMD